jgi:hypothetical protein
MNQVRHRQAIALAATALLAFAALLLAPAARGQLTPQMTAGIPGAVYVRPDSTVERAIAAQTAMNLAARPLLGTATSLTPDAPYARDGAHLSVWKPSFVLGTPAGGEIGINFWGIHNQGHVNVGFTSRSGGTYLLDCRLIASGSVTYKVYAGSGSDPLAQGEQPLAGGHLFVAVPARAGVPVSVELWPTPGDAPFGFLGCEICRASIPVPVHFDIEAAPGPLDPGAARLPKP